MATLFDDIVLRRPRVGKQLNMRPLWRLKLSDGEFKELQFFLRIGGSRSPDWFKKYPRECLLFFAEYWKRFYDGGKHSVSNVINCLIEDADRRTERAFYEAARKGASRLGIEIYEGENDRRRTLDSILYQGGLPMRLICQSNRDGFQNWTEFTRRLVRGYIDLSDDELGLGQVATNLQSIRHYARQLYLGVATNNPEAMPFHCPDANHPWYKELLGLKESEQRKSKETTPFSIDWVIELDDRRGRGRILARVQIPSRLSQEFLQEQSKEDCNNSSVRVMTDGLARASVEYQQGYARMSRDILIPLPTSESTVSVYFEEKVVATGNFDYTRPHLFSFNGRQSNGLLQGEKSNRIKESEMILFLPKDWTLETGLELEKAMYEFSNDTIYIVRLPPVYSKDLRFVDGKGDTIVFNGTPIGVTQLLYTPLYSELVLSPSICDASLLQRCHILTEMEDGIHRQPRLVEFEESKNGVWSPTPAIGRIRARGVGTDKELSEPVTLCNVGNDFQINVVEADYTEASIRISWPHGQVTCLENDSEFSIRDHSWKVKKASLLNQGAVRFRLTVTGGSSTFILKIRAPFKQMQITDEFGEEVDGRVYVPLCDYDKFSYTIFGVNSARIEVDSVKFRVSGLNKKLMISEEEATKDIPSRKIYRHGSIAALFGSSGKMRQLLDKQRGTIINSNVKATLRAIKVGKSIELSIREYPFMLRWNQEDNTFILQDPDDKERPFRHSLLVFRLKKPNLPPVTISPDEDGFLRMPTELVSEHDLLIAGNVPGRVRPSLVNKSDKEHSTFEIASIVEKQILGAPIGSEIWKDCFEWFNQAARYGIPFSSLLQLKAISRHSETLIAFLFQCISEYGLAEREDMIERLLQFSRDLSFKWFWLIPVLSQGLFRILESRFFDINDESFIRLLVPPEISPLPMEYLSHIATGLIPDKMVQLEKVLIELIKKSFEHTHRAISDDIYEVACGWIDKKGKYEGRKLETKYDWFPDFSSFLGTPIEEFESYKEKNRPQSENWLISRVWVFCDYMTEGKIDLFSMSHDARRSLCLCYEVAPYYFIREAHNRMIDLRKNRK